MTRSLSPTFQSHLQGSLTTLAHVLLITLRNGRQIGFTTHDRPLIINGLTYSPNNSMIPTAAQTTLEAVGSNAEVTGYFSTDAITEIELMSGALDGALYTLALVNWQSPSLNSADCIILGSGKLGKLTADDQTYRVEALSLTEILKEDKQPRITTVCTAEFGDGRCNASLAAHTFNATVVDGDRYGVTLSDLTQANGWFDNGLLVLGASQFRIKSWFDNRVEFTVPLFSALASGTVVQVISGCDKLAYTCRSKFSNIINYRGFPHLPNKDDSVRGPDKGSTIRSNWASDQLGGIVGVYLGGN